jgi:hypothetical protein
MTPPVSSKPQSSSGNFFQMVLDMFNVRYSSFYIVLYIFLNLALSVEKNSTVIKIIRADVLPRFAEFLSRHGLPQLQVCSLLLSPHFLFYFILFYFILFYFILFYFILFYFVVNLVSFLQMEAAWVLTNIAASDYTLLVAECGAVPRLVELLGSPNANIRHQVKQLY